MWRIVHSPFGLHLRALRDNRAKAEYLGVQVHQFRLAAFVDLRGLRRHRRRDPWLSHRAGGPGARALDAFRHLVFMTVLGGFANFLGPMVGALALTLLQDQLQSITQYWRFVLAPSWPPW